MQLKLDFLTKKKIHKIYKEKNIYLDVSIESE